MKRYIYTALLAVLTMLTSCEKDIEAYSDSNAYLNFMIDTANPEERSFSFVYSGDVEQDTMWVRLTTMGFVSHEDRQFQLEQVITGENDAVAGRHYKALGELEQYYVIKADSVGATVPIVLLRDASLKDQTVVLKLAVKDNGIFKPGFVDNRNISLYVADQLVKPNNWEAMYLDYYLCYYTKGVHQFLINLTGERWDEEYISTYLTDTGYVSYLATWAKKALAEENARRVAAGQDVLREEDGTPVVIKGMWD